MDDTRMKYLDQISGKRYEQELRYLLDHRLISAALERLRKETPSHYTYHNSQHTEGVIKDSLLLAILENLDKRSIELLGIAAAYHDLGFLYQYDNNEILGADLAATAMTTTSEYSEEEITTVREMILDTKLIEKDGTLTRNVSNTLSPYLLDADISNVGKGNFHTMNELILAEQNKDPETFRAETIKFLKTISWNTKTAARLWEDQRTRNLADYSKKKSS
jgi:uncharacterized protein